MRTARLARRVLLAIGLAALPSCADASSSSPPPATTDAAERIPYGDGSQQFGDLVRPNGVDGPPVVVLIHGGFWQAGFDLTLMDGLADALVERGYATWNIEYRSLGNGGGHPATFDDVATAVDHLAMLDGLDLTRVAVVGHSAGGHLAAWVAGRHTLDPDAVGAEPLVTPVLAIPLAGVLDLEDCIARRIGGSSCADLIGGASDLFPVTAPIAMVPIGVPVVAVHGSADTIVPPDQSSSYVAAAVAAGDPAESLVIVGADHFDVIDPTSDAWAAVSMILDDRL